LHRPKPKVLRGDEFGLLLVGRALGDESDSIRIQFLVMNEVAADIGDERVAMHVFGKSVAAIDGDAGRRSKITGSAPPAFDWTGDLTAHAPLGADHTPRLFGADSINFRRWTIGRNVDEWRRHYIIWVPRSVALFIHRKPDVRAIMANEFSAGVVEAQAMLSAPNFSPKIRQVARIK